jgi:hypothetical protein
MAAFPGRHYAPPNPYTQTDYENPLQGAIDSLKVPIFIGEGNEYLSQIDLEVVRGSSATVDQRVVGEDMTGRAVVSVSATGVVTRSNYDGALNRVQVRNLPIVDGKGRGTTTNSRNDVSVTINSLPVVVVQVDGAAGLITLAQAPALGDLVRVSYFFNREDTYITDDLSDQVTAENAIVRAAIGLLDVNAPTPGTATIDLHADELGPNGTVSIPANNVLNLIVDGLQASIELTPKTDYTMQQIANVISGAAVGTLTGATFVNNHGESTLSLNSDHDIQVLDGSANAQLGLAAGQTSTRRKTFYTVNGPIVDGTNGGVTTTDPSHVTVKVDGTQVIPASVDGATRAITLTQAPEAGATVTVAYWFNTWQDTYDHLQHVNVQALTRVGDVPGGSQYIQGTDFVLEDDRVMWGTAALVAAGTTTTGTELFDDTQITPVLIDNKTFLSSCTPVVSSQGAASVTDFQLPLSPTLGNGRDTSLGQSLFQSVANNRIGVPVNRPDVVQVYWGFGVDDALARGEVTVVRVEGSVITLQDPVPVGANVYATFYHNMIADMAYTFTVVQAGVSGVGTYTIQNSGGVDIYTPTFDNSTKSAGLTGVDIVFPSGSELNPDLHFEGGSGTTFTGPVEEIVQVTFAATPNTPAKFTVQGSAPYAFIPGDSDLVAMTVNSQTVLAAAGRDLDLISAGTGAAGAGIMAHFVGDVLPYADGIDHDLADFTGGDEDIILTVDGVEITANIEAAANTTAVTIAQAINEAADGHVGVVGAVGPTTTAFTAGPNLLSNTDDFYNGYRVVVGNGAVNITGGSVGTVLDYNGTSGLVTLAAVIDGANAFAATDVYRMYNPDTMPVIKGATRFNGPIDLSGAAGFDTIDVRYNGSTTGTATYSATVAVSHASIADLATALNVVFRGVTPVGGHTFDTPPTGAGLLAQGTIAAADEGTDFIFSADGDGRLQVHLQACPADRSAYLEFIEQAATVDDLAILAGFDVDAADGAQAKMFIGSNDATGPVVDQGIATAYRVTVGGLNTYDRLLLRSRIHPGGNSLSALDVVGQCQLLVGAGSGNEKAGLTTGDFGSAAPGATVQAATALGRVGFGGGTNTAGEPEVVFYDGSGTQAANDTFVFTLDGEPITVDFGGSDTGATLVLGIESAAGSIIRLIQDELVVNGTWGNLAAVQAANIVRQEGAGIRITSQDFHSSGRIEIGGGTANSLLGFAEGMVAARTLVSAEVLASALNCDRSRASLSAFYFDFSASTANVDFADQALAKVVEDSASRTYLHVIAADKAGADYGAASNITLLDATTRSWLFVGTGIDELTTAGSAGDAAMNGYYVTSSDAAGTGTANTSILNAGTGQDGIIGQTYRDAVTGLTFTVLPRGWHDNKTGPWTAYPVAATFNFRVSKTATTDANLPIRSIPGIELKVANTSGVGVGDTSLVTTYPRGGQEPAIGDLYYATYVYQKQDFTTAFFTRMQSIIAAYGAIHPDNPVTLASYLAVINGAMMVGIKQVPREENSNFASTTSYVSALTELEGVLPGHIEPDMIIPLKGDSTEFFQLLARSNDIQSSIRYRSERTSIIGVAAGTSEEAAKTLAQTLNNDRMRMVYPDMALLDIEETDGTTKEYLIDGPMLAAMLAGSVVSPNLDVATPWTRRRLVGPSQLARTLDAVAENQLAVAGITVLSGKPPFIQVRHGLTTDMENILTKTPTVRLIADHVHQQSRATLDQFIGLKFLPGILSQIEGRLAKMMQTLVKQNIIAIYTGLRATVDPEDPTTANVEAYYQPVFPLLYIILEFHLRRSL